MRSPLAAAAVFLGFVVAPASAGATPLTLPDAVQYAIAHSPDISKQVAVVSQTQAAYVHARSVELPGVTGSLENQMQKSQNFAGAYSIIGAPQASVFSQNTASLGTSYTFNGGLALLQTQLARQQYEQAKADLAKTQQQVTLNVSSAYYSLATKRATIRLDEGDLRYQAALVAVAKAKERAGVAAGVDVLSANAQQEKSRYTLEAAQADADNAREALAQTIGAPLDTEFDVPDTVAEPALPPQPLDALIGLATANRAEVASAMEGVRIAQTNRRSADTDLLPQVQTFASIGNQFSPTLFAQELQFNPALPRGTPGYWNIGVISQINLPLWDWGARRANHRNLDEQIAAADDTLHAAQTQVELDVRQAYRAAQTAQAQLISAQGETRFALEAARIARLQYENGLKTLIDVQQAQQTSLSAQADLFNARVAYVNAVIKLRSALGIFTPEQDVADLK